jgi:hypothetical protein
MKKSPYRKMSINQNKIRMRSTQKMGTKKKVLRSAFALMGRRSCSPYPLLFKSAQFLFLFKGGAPGGGLTCEGGGAAGSRGMQPGGVSKQHRLAYSGHAVFSHSCALMTWHCQVAEAGPGIQSYWRCARWHKCSTTRRARGMGPPGAVPRCDSCRPIGRQDYE